MTKYLLFSLVVGGCKTSPGDTNDTDDTDQTVSICDEPNPIRFEDLRVSLHEGLEVLDDGGFELGTAEVRARFDSDSPELKLAKMKIDSGSARNGSAGFLLLSEEGEGGDFAVRVFVDKGYENTYSM